jgi:hypothetical protein
MAQVSIAPSSTHGKYIERRDLLHHLTERLAYKKGVGEFKVVKDSAGPKKCCTGGPSWCWVTLVAGSLIIIISLTQKEPEAPPP